jgi:hypothetical protein
VTKLFEDNQALRKYRDYFQRSLKDEMDFLVDVFSGRAQDRPELADKVFNQLGSFLGLADIVSPISVSKVVLLAHELFKTAKATINKHEKIQKASLAASILSYDPKQMEVLIDYAVVQATYRYAAAIEHLFQEASAREIGADTVIARVATIGAMRVLGYMLEKNEPFDAGTVLKALFEGPSGRGKDSFLNNDLMDSNLFDRAYRAVTGGEQLKFTAEGFYKRCGFLTEDGVYWVDSELVNFEKPENLESAHRPNWLNRLVGANNPTKRAMLGTAEIHALVPKYGYIQIPRQLIGGSSQYAGYRVQEASSDRALEALSLSYRYVGLADIVEYLKQRRQGEAGSFNIWLKGRLINAVADDIPDFSEALASRFKIEKPMTALYNGVIDGAELETLGVDFGMGDFSGVDFSGTRFMNCTLGLLKGARLIACEFSNVLATDDVLDEASLVLSTMTHCSWKGLKGFRLDLSHTQVISSQFDDLSFSGSVKLDHMHLDEPSRCSFSSGRDERNPDLSRRIAELERISAEQREWYFSELGVFKELVRRHSVAELANQERMQLLEARQDAFQRKLKSEEQTDHLTTIDRQQLEATMAAMKAEINTLSPMT